MSEHPTQFLWHATANGSDIRVEIARAFFRDISRLTVDGQTVAEASGIRVRDVAATVPTSQGPVPVTASFSGSSFALNDASRLCTVTWNHREIPLEVLKAPWVSTKPRWLRLVLILALIAITIGLESALPAIGTDSIRLILPVLLLLLLLNVPYNKPAP